VCEFDPPEEFDEALLKMKQRLGYVKEVVESLKEKKRTI
jgi:hypothetical protein